MVKVRLFHGTRGTSRDRPEMNEWGPEERVLGPFDHVQVTYGHHIKCWSPIDRDLTELWYDQDCVAYDGCVFGDFIVFAAEEEG